MTNKFTEDAIKPITDYRTLDDVAIEYFTHHPEKIDAFLNETFVA